MQPPICAILKKMSVLDTSARAKAVTMRRLAEMTPSERVHLGVQLWQAADSLQRSALRRLNPAATEDEILFQIACRRFGPELARMAYKRA